MNQLDYLCLSMIVCTQAEKEPTPPFQIPAMSKPSVYHNVLVSMQMLVLWCIVYTMIIVLQLSPQQLSPPSLTEAMLQRHNETELSTVKPSFVGKSINVNNR